MSEKRYRVFEIISMCLSVITIGLVVTILFSLSNDIKKLDNRIAELENRQKYIEFRLLETEKPTCFR